MTTTAAVRMARRLMNRHGLGRWTVNLNKARCQFGSCLHHKRQITLSEPLLLLNSKADVRETILHEIAHALIPEKHGHDKVWKAMAVRIGATPKAACRNTVVTLPSLPAKYIFRCPKCHRRTEGHRRPYSPSACGHCCDRYADGKFDARFALTCEDRDGNPVAYESNLPVEDTLEQWLAHHTCSRCGYRLHRRKCTNQGCKNHRTNRKEHKQPK